MDLLKKQNKEADRAEITSNSAEATQTEGLYGQELMRGVETPAQNDNWEQVRVGGARAEEQKLTEEKLMAQMTLEKTEIHRK